MSTPGDPVHFEVKSADASGGVAVTIYNDGSTAARTLASNEILHITDVCLMAEAGGDAGLFADSDAAGKRVVAGAFDILSGISHEFSKAYACPKGVTPKVIADAGNVDLCGQGYITGV